MDRSCRTLFRGHETQELELVQKPPEGSDWTRILQGSKPLICFEDSEVQFLLIWNTLLDISRDLI